jgi:DNA-binding CsgD family transcriptional regulator
MATEIVNGETSVTNDAAPTQVELISLLLSRVEAAKARGSVSPPKDDNNEGEEIILDVELEAARYLLIRMPRVNYPCVQLSPREQEIARMVAKGHPNKVIAEVLNISCWTVCTYLRRIFAKLGVASRAAMVARLLENTRAVKETKPLRDALRLAEPPTKIRRPLLNESRTSTLPGQNRKRFKMFFPPCDDTRIQHAQ